MLFPSPLKSAQLLQRYKRFLADVIDGDKQQLRLHCANTGRMTGCAMPGDRVWYSCSSNSKRRYPYSWQLTETKAGHFVHVNTHTATAIVTEALIKQRIPELSGYDSISREVPYGQEHSRIDLLLRAAHRQPCYIEIKSVTLYDPIRQTGYFPDAVTLRGQKHIRELIALRQQGMRAVLFFLIQHSAITVCRVATHIDPVYSDLLHKAWQAGVEVLCYDTTISPQHIELRRRIPFCLDELA